MGWRPLISARGHEFTRLITEAQRRQGSESRFSVASRDTTFEGLREYGLHL